MQKNSYNIFSFVNEFNLSDLHQLSKDICIIYRNYDNINHLENILKLKKYCKNIKTKFYLSNNIKLSIKLRLDGVYIPSFNKRINYAQNYSLPINFDIIGSIPYLWSPAKISPLIFNNMRSNFIFSIFIDFCL